MTVQVLCVLPVNWEENSPWAQHAFTTNAVAAQTSNEIAVQPGT
nr:hypothetical protein [Candidatus Anoxychlamydiales bacterium]